MVAKKREACERPSTKGTKSRDRSSGITVHPTMHTTETDEICGHGDVRAKQAGRDTYRFFKAR